MVGLASCSDEELYTTAKTSVYSGSLTFIVFLIKTSTAQNRKTKNGAGAK